MFQCPSWCPGGGGDTPEPGTGDDSEKVGFIQLEYYGDLNSEQKGAFQNAARRWDQVIKKESFDPVTLPNGTKVEGMLIQAKGTRIDGPSGVLGRAGPTAIRRNGIPYVGIMEFDTADLASLERNGTLNDVIMHEMGHTFGIGTLWQANRLLVGSGTRNPEFVGEGAMKEYAKLLGESGTRRVPVANTGGPGTREGHWREAVFDEELMTGLAEARDMPLSAMTIASLSDLGYQVNLEAADPYTLPGKLQAAVTGAEKKEDRKMCAVTFPAAKKKSRRCFCCG